MQKCSLLLFFSLIFGVAIADDGCLCPKQTVGKEIAISNEPRRQFTEDIAVDSETGNYLIVYDTDDRFVGSNPVEIHASLWSAKGEQLSPALLLDSSINQTAQVTGAAFNPLLSEFVVIILYRLQGVSHFRAFRISRAGELLASPIIQSVKVRFSFAGDLLYNPITNEFVISYLVQLQPAGDFRFTVRKMDHNYRWSPIKRVFSFSNAQLRHDPRTNRYLLASKRLVSGQYQFHALLLDRNLITIRKLPMVHSQPDSPYGPYPVYHSVSGQFVLFWTHGYKDRRIQARIISPEGSFASSVFDTGARGFVRVVRSNPLGGFLFLSWRPHATRLSEDFKTSVSFPLTCDLAEVSNSGTLIFNRKSSEFLATYSVPTKPSTDLFGRRIRASAKGTCDP